MNKKANENQNKCQNCIWVDKQDGIAVFCPFSKCIKNKKKSN